MSDVGAVATALNTFATIWDKRPGRLKRQALISAKKYIDINETGKLNGRVLDAKNKKKWLLHYKKQVEAWG
jgi:hypothetical protein